MKTKDFMLNILNANIGTYVFYRGPTVLSVSLLFPFSIKYAHYRNIP